jgi:hypothetical protein
VCKRGISGEFPTLPLARYTIFTLTSNTRWLAEMKSNLLATDIALMAKAHSVALQRLPSQGLDVMRIAGGPNLGRRRQLNSLFAAQPAFCKVKLEVRDG